MSRFFRRRSHKIGLPPGTLVAHDTFGAHPVHLRVFDYNADTLVDRELTGIEDALAFRQTDTATWINIDGLHDLDIVRALGEGYGLHPLVLEDIVSGTQRPKTEVFEDHLFVVIKMLRFDEKTRELDVEQVSLIIGDAFVLSFQEKPGDVFEPVRHRLRNPGSRLRQHGPDYLAYALLDVLVDHYFVVLEQFGELAEDLEEVVLQDPSPATQQQLRDLRRELILARRNIWPVRDLMATLARTESPLLSAFVTPYLRDVQDHTIQAIDIVESLRDVLASLMDLYLSSLSNRMNEIMKVLTIIGTIFIPLTFIAGIYGMNFEHMPELGWTYAYPVFWVVLLSITTVLMFFFRRRHWL